MGRRHRRNNRSLVALIDIHGRKILLTGDIERRAEQFLARNLAGPIDLLKVAHHGSLTVGRTLWEAYMRLEKVEHTAEITLAAQQLGQVRTLTPQAVDKLVDKRRQLLQQEGRDICEGCTVCELGDAQGAASMQSFGYIMNNFEGETTRQ